MKNDRIAAIKEASDCRVLFKRFFPDHFREHGNSLCPFHGDSDPSCQVTREKAHCHAEGKSWDAIDLYEAGTGLGKKDAVAALCAELGISVESAPGTSGIAHRARSESKTGKDASASVEHVERWKKLVSAKLSEQAVSYWKKRSLPEDLAASLQAKGMLGFDAKRHALAFPVTDPGKKQLLGIQFVPVDGAPKKFAKGTAAKNGFFRYGSGTEYCVVTEAVIDALSVHAACPGLSIEVVSVYSASQWKNVGQLGGAPVLFLDNDPGGIKATCRALRAFPGKVRIADWSIAPEGCKDVNDLLKLGHSEAIERMVRLSKCPRDDGEIASEISAQLSRLETQTDALKKGDPKRFKDAQTDLERFRKEVESDGAAVALRGAIEERIAQLNESHAVIMIGGRCAVMNEFRDPIFSTDGMVRWGIDFSSVQDFKHYHANERYPIETEPGRTKFRDIGSLWFESPLRRQYRSIVFAPGESHNGYYNLYRGFTCRPVKGDWSLMQEHIYSVIASKDTKVFDYILAWLAHLFQQPGGKRPGTSIVLRGDQGVGKGCFVGNIGKMLGCHYLHIANSKQLTGRFNNHLKDALLVFVDEGVWAGDKAAEGVLKAMVTEDYFTIEPKGKDPFTVRSHLRLIVASNNDWVVPAGLKERRFCVLDVSDCHAQDNAYFGRIHDQMDHGGREAMLYDLLNDVDISTFDLNDFPRTAALFDQQVSTMKTAHKFWMERLRAGSLRDDTDIWEAYVPTRDLYQDYVNFANAIGDRYPSIDLIFTRTLREVCPQIRRSRPMIDYQGKRQRIPVLAFPSLNECREAFEISLRRKIDWEDEPDY